jgi:replicative DNA helicase
MTLPQLSRYGYSFQVKVLSLLLEEKNFLLNVHDVLDSSYFENSGHKWTINTILKYWEDYHTVPTIDVLKSEYQKIEDEVLKASVKEQLQKIFAVSSKDRKYVREEFTKFCRNQQVKKAILTSTDLLKHEDYDSIRNLMNQSLQAGMDKNVGHEYEKDIEDRYRANHRKIVPTPWTKINKILQGGLGNGDFGLIFGNPGGGKSWTLVAIGGNAIQMGFNVLHYTLELGEEYVARRYDSFFTKTPVNTIMAHRTKVESLIKELPGRLIIKEFPTGKASISTVESHIQKCIDNDFKPNLVLIDYVDLLYSQKRTRERKDEIDDIYTSTKGMAKELDIPIWTVSQVNRAGAKDEIIEGDKAAGSYDKLMISDFALSLSRKKEDKIQNTGRFHVMKNRYGFDGITYSVVADTSMGAFEVFDYKEAPESPTQNVMATNYSQADNASILKSLKDI